MIKKASSEVNTIQFRQSEAKIKKKTAGCAKTRSSENTFLSKEISNEVGNEQLTHKQLISRTKCGRTCIQCTRGTYS